MIEQMFLSPGKRLKVTKTTPKKKKRYDSHCNIRKRFGGFQIIFQESLIISDRAAVCGDIKVDSVTKLPQYGGLMRAFWFSYTLSAPRLIYIKALKASYPTRSTKLIQNPFRLQIILTILKLRCWCSNHANLAHQHFKTSSGIARCINPLRPPPPPEKENCHEVICH